MESTNKTKSIIPLWYLKANEAMFMLGMNLAMGGNNKDQVKYMKKKSMAWAIYVRVGVIQ